MNGLANTVLSFLLSWIRSIVRNIWTVISSENSGTLYQFLTANWKTLLVVLCIGGFLVDRIIYFIRWRPYYVWMSRWRRLRSRRKEVPEPVPQRKPQPQPEAPTSVYRPYAAPAPTMVYAPVQSAPQPTQFYAPVQDDEMLEDERWADDEPIEMDWQQPVQPQYAPPQPEPNAYYRDVQAGFAPAISPQQLYARPVQNAASPVHPGLNEEAFRQNFGLDEEEQHPAAVMHAPAFRPFTAVQEEAPAPSRSALSRLAKRARDLVGMEDEDHAPSIRDLQSTVDVTQAFHEPVYPQPLNRQEPL